MISEENPKPRSINIIRERLNASASFFASVYSFGTAGSYGASYSWLGSNKKHINKRQMVQMKELYETLFSDRIDRKNTKLCKKLLNRKEKNVYSQIS